ncbi:hypothetical protein PIB30_041865 [Stylosanthes scabra]|uniref:Ribonuclease H1 N-terminal domain-containing protein n=1 Tax=Stylosanthes scabra TaxID=79078 RepID=A0ABU6VEN5_9FABA|nr:hypothetical protein [Stylosanthes scabra]
MSNFRSKRIMITQESFPYYVVFRGRVPGVYNSWEEASQQVIGYSDHSYKGFHKLYVARNEWLLHLIKTKRDSQNRGISMNINIGNNAPLPMRFVAPMVIENSDGGGLSIEYRHVQTVCEMCSLKKENEALRQLVNNLRDYCLSKKLALELDI